MIQGEWQEKNGLEHMKISGKAPDELQELLAEVRETLELRLFVRELFEKF